MAAIARRAPTPLGSENKGGPPLVWAYLNAAADDIALGTVMAAAADGTVDEVAGTHVAPAFAQSGAGAWLGLLAQATGTVSAGDLAPVHAFLPGFLYEFNCDNTTFAAGDLYQNYGVEADANFGHLVNTNHALTTVERGVVIVALKSMYGQFTTHAFSAQAETSSVTSAGVSNSPYADQGIIGDTYARVLVSPSSDACVLTEGYLT